MQELNSNQQHENERKELFVKVHYWDCRAKQMNGSKPTCSGNCEYCFYGTKKSRIYELDNKE